MHTKLKNGACFVTEAEKKELKSSTMKRVMIWLIATFVCSASVCNAQQGDESAMGYPQAEWLRAGDILMHTPGQELFNGVIHPAAGLFEDYFDVDKAAEEHQGYIEMLRKNGIRVHTVADILAEHLAGNCSHESGTLWALAKTSRLSAKESA